MRRNYLHFLSYKLFTTFLFLGILGLNPLQGEENHLHFANGPSLRTSLETITANPEVETTLNIFNDIFFLSPAVGYCVGSQGRILFTDDGGKNWLTRESGVKTNLISLFVLDKNHIWVGGENGTILYGDGQHWKLQLADLNAKIYGIQFWDPNNGFAIAGNRILATSDGGANWRVVSQKAEISQVGIQFHKPGTGWTYGGTADSGAVLLRWEQFKPARVKMPASTRFFYDMELNDTENGWLVGSGSQLLRTRDGGRTWNYQSVNIESGMIYKIDFVDQMHGWLISQLGEIYRTQNGGESWELAHQTPHLLLDLHFVDRKSGWVVGNDGLILKTEDGGETWVRQEQKHSMYLSFFKGAYCVIARKVLADAKLYMHIPVTTQYSTPLVFQLNESNLSHKIKAFRTVQMRNDNWLAEITFRNLEAGDSLFISWSSWVLQRKQNFSDLPEYVDVQWLQQLPDSVRPYLAATKIVQSRNPQIQGKARELAQGSNNILEIAKRIIHFTGNAVEYKGGSEQDAFSTLQNGMGVCNGKANLAMALFRAQGIPARTLMVANTHFIIEYYVPNYGWVRAEPTQGKHIQPAQENIVMWIANPEDENASPYNGIVCYWGTRNPDLAYDILYDHAELQNRTNGIESETELADIYLQKAKQVWQRYHRYVNYNRSSIGQTHFDLATRQQNAAIHFFQAESQSEFYRRLELAQTAFEYIDRQSMTSVKEDGLAAQEPFLLLQNYPNPFNARTQIQYSLHRSGRVRLQVFNIAGQVVRNLVDDFLQVGSYSVTWDGLNNQGQTIASGIYFYRLEFLGKTQERELMLLK